MAVRFFSGLETGDASEWVGSFGTLTFDQTIVRGGGGYSLSLPWNNSNHYIYTSFSPQLSSAYLRFGLYTTAAGGTSVSWLVGFNHSGVVIGAIRMVTDGGGGVYLRLYNNVAGAQVGSDVLIPSSNWLLVELQLQVSATVGVLEMRVNGVVVATGSNLNTGTNTVDALQMTQQNISGSGATGNVWFDDIMVRDDQYPGNGYCLARQGNTTAPNYNSWTLTGGSNIWSVWGNTPVNTSTFASTATASNEQTMVVDFTTVGGTGSTGHGTGTVGSFDLINAFKVSTYGKTSSTTTDGADSTIFRTPAGGGGSDTLTSLAVWTSGFAYQETILSSTPSLTQVRSCEVGVSKGTGTNTHSVADVWAMVDYIPTPYTMFQGSETEPYTPLSYETLVEDGGEEQSWYPSINDESALFLAQLSILIVDMPSRTFAEVSEGDIFPPIDTDVGALFFLFLPPPIIGIVTSQWDNATVPLDVEELTEESEGDYYPDFGSPYLPGIQPNISFYVSASQWDNQSADFIEVYSEESDGDYYPDTSIDNAWYFCQVTPFYLLMFNDYSPDDFDGQTEPSETDYYPPREEELQWFIPTTFPTTTLFGSWVYNILNGQLPTSQPTGNLVFSGGGTGSASWVGTAYTGTEGLQIQTIGGGTLGSDSAIPSDNLVLTGNELFIVYYTILDNIPSQIEVQLYEQTTATWFKAYLGTDHFGLGGANKGAVPTVTGFWLSFTFTAKDLGLTAGKIITGVAWGVYNAAGTSTVVFSDTLSSQTVLQDNLVASQWDNQAADYLELYTDDLGDGDYYPDFDVDSTSILVAGLPIAMIFVDFAPDIYDDDASDEPAWYAPQDELLSWFIPPPANENFIFNEYIPWDTDQLIEDDGSDQSWYAPFGNEVENWLNIAPSTLLVFLDFSPLELDQLIEDDGSDAWYVPSGNEVEDWIQLLPAPTQIIVSASQFYAQAADFLEIYTDDLSDPDIYPDTSIDNTWYFNQTFQLNTSLLSAINQLDDAGISVPLSFEEYIEDDGSEPIWYPIEGNIIVKLIPQDIIVLMVASEFYQRVIDTPEFYFEDLGEEQSWYPPQDELLSWFIPNTFIPYIFTDYSPLELEQLIEDEGSEQAWYPAIEDVLSPTIFAQQLSDAFILVNYTPADTDQLLEDTGEEQAWYPAKEEELQWYIPHLLSAFAVFNDYAPLELEQLTEESEGDFYPDFGVDPSAWSFLLASGITILISSNSFPETPDDQIQDLGDEPAWYLVTGDILSFFIPSGIEVLVASSQEYGRATDFLELYTEESDGDYYPPQDDNFSWFFNQVLIITNFVFNDYNPLELEQLTEEQEGDFYPDFSIDPAPWFFTVQPNSSLYVAALQWEALPREMEFLTEDSGEDISWFYPLDIVIVLIGSIKYQFNMPLTTTIQLYFNLVEFTSSATQIIYGN